MADGEDTFKAGILLDGLRVVALRLDEGLIIQQIAGDWCPIDLGVDVREAVPALFGMEDELTQEVPYIHLPFVSLGTDQTTPASISVQRDPVSRALWVLLRDVSEEAAVQEKLVQQHNSLAIAHRKLAAARDAALAADRAKTSFLANVSHELRTPLNVIIGGSSILLKERKTPLPPLEVRDFAKDIHESGKLLLQLVDDLIDLSRAETGNLSIYEEWCQPVTLADEMTRLVRGLPQAAGMEISYLSHDNPPDLYADPRRIKQILLNLLSNAIKACRQGAHIEVHIRVDPESRDLLLAVQDDGPGMSAGELEVAMEPFGQPHADRRAQGAGLGLAIVSRLARLHQGSFKIDTAPGDGVKATIRLPSSRLSHAKEV